MENGRGRLSVMWKEGIFGRWGVVEGGRGEASASVHLFQLPSVASCSQPLFCKICQNPSFGWHDEISFENWNKSPNVTPGQFFSQWYFIWFCNMHIFVHCICQMPGVKGPTFPKTSCSTYFHFAVENGRGRGAGRWWGKFLVGRRQKIWAEKTCTLSTCVSACVLVVVIWGS